MVGLIAYILAVIFTKFIGNQEIVVEDSDDEETLESQASDTPTMEEGSEESSLLESELDVEEFKEFLDYQMKGLYLFNEIQNSILYTYSILLQVSVPRMPHCWTLRMILGWWWFFTVLITVFYKASMTATLANSIER